MAIKKRNIRQKKSRRLNLCFFGGFLALIICIFIWQSFRIIRSAVWDGRSQINLIVSAQDLYFVSFSPGEGGLAVVSIAPEIYVEASYGYGSYPFKSVYDLGEIDKRGGQVLSATAQEFFAAPIDGWLYIPEGKLNLNQAQEAREKIATLLWNSTAEIEGEKIRTNLNFWDKIRLWWKIKDVRANRIKYLYLGEKQFTESQDSPEDRSHDKGFYDALDRDLKPLLIQEQIREEALKVDILNSTDKAGLGNRIGRFINNLGSEVINIDNQKESRDRCLIVVKKINESKLTVQKLRKIFSCDIEVNESIDSRGDLIFIIGKDYWERLTQRKQR